MKAILIVLFALFCIGLSAVEYIDVVYRTNGDVLKGNIIENVPNDQIKIDISGVVVTVKYNEIIKMTKEPIGGYSAPAPGATKAARDFFFNKKYGLKLGINSANVKLENASDSDLKSMYGISLGGFYMFQTSKNIIIQPELLYTNKGFDFDYSYDDGEYEYSESNEFRFSYLEIPVLVKYIVPSGNLCFMPYVGPSLGISLGGKLKYDYEEYDYYYDEYYHESGTEDIDDYIEDIDFGLNLGCDVYFSDKFGIGLRYTPGLSNIFTGEMSEADAKNKVWNLSLSYTF
jgi:hypothetical protein